jgi:hypothetical protein
LALLCIMEGQSRLKVLLQSMIEYLVLSFMTNSLLHPSDSYPTLFRRRPIPPTMQYSYGRFAERNTSFTTQDLLYLSPEPGYHVPVLNFVGSGTSLHPRSFPFEVSSLQLSLCLLQSSIIPYLSRRFRDSILKGAGNITLPAARSFVSWLSSV